MEKSEARNAKYETKFKNKTQMIQTVLNFGYFENSDLFRISRFGFRIYNRYN
jgi:hypothetical protein